MFQVKNKVFSWQFYEYMYADLIFTGQPQIYSMTFARTIIGATRFIGIQYNTAHIGFKFKFIDEEKIQVIGNLTWWQ